MLASLSARPLVLVLENLDRLFDDFGTNQQRQLRALVETSRAVMLVASTPALFAAISKQTQPWFGSFAIERLVPWSVAEGTAFLERIARDRGDGELAALIASPIGRARLIAVDKLVGGLPRLWTILAGCITVELLEELVPLVLATLEELVPYYQARLNDLPPSERKLVVALCRAETLGGDGGRTVAELALAAGVPTGSAPKLLGRLEDSGWVRATKPPGTDRRATWYELREPLLRYHLAYRGQAGAPLSLIVSFVRAWFSPTERRQRLAEAEGGTLTEAYLAESLRDAPRPSDSLYAAASPTDLIAGAREWFAAAPEATAVVRSRVAAIVAEIAVMIATGHAEGVDRTMCQRLSALSEVDRAGVAAIGRAVERAALDARARAASPDSLGAQQAVVLAGLDAAAAAAEARAEPEDSVAIALLAHGWRGATGDVAGAYAAFCELAQRAQPLDRRHAALRLAVEAEQAFFGCKHGNRDVEGARMARVLADRDRILGPDHPDTLTSRSNLAYWTGEAGDAATARDQYAALIPDCERILGPDHPDTLTRRSSLAYWTGKAGDAATARDHYAALIPDRERILGPDHPDTLTRRGSLAYWTGEAGDAATARDQFATLIPDSEHILGPDHPDTLTRRSNLAYWTRAAGDAATGRDQLAALIDDRNRILGPDHPDTVVYRSNLALWTGQDGDVATARDQLAALIRDIERVGGADQIAAAARLALAALQPGRAVKRDALLSLLAAGDPQPLPLDIARALDQTLVESDLLRLAAADDSQDWLAIAQILRLGGNGAGLAAVARSVGALEIDGGQIARRLAETAAGLEHGVAYLTATILTAVDGQPWARADLERWLARWSAALARTPNTQIAIAALDTIGREAAGDNTARPSLPPELRDIVPRVRLATRVGPDLDV
jgi:hypothetical protein